MTLRRISRVGGRNRRAAQTLLFSLASTLLSCGSDGNSGGQGGSNQDASANDASSGSANDSTDGGGNGGPGPGGDRDASLDAGLLDSGGGKHGDAALLEDAGLVLDGSAAADAQADAGPNPCDDENPITEDFMSDSYGCGHIYDENPEDLDRFVDYEAGFSIDVATGIAWAMLGPGSLSRDGVAAACDTLTIGALTNFRIPTINETRGLAAGCPDTVPGGTCPIDDPGSLAQADGTGSDCSSCTGGMGPNTLYGGGSYCKPDVVPCSHWHTSSDCSDCGSPSNWQYVPSNGNFVTQANSTLIGGVCVQTGVTPELP